MTTIREWELDFWRSLLKGFSALEGTVSIVLQGPLHDRVKRSIPPYLKLVRDKKYKNYGNLVISYWDSDKDEVLDQFRKEEDIEFVRNVEAEAPKGVTKKGSRGASSWILQNHTTLEGVKKATGHKTIKVRSDEIYPDIEKINKKLDKILDRPQGGKFVTSDIYFRRDAHEKFHPSDHIIAGKTSMMRRGFEAAVRKCQSKLSRKYKFPEQLICEALLSANGVSPIEYKSKKIMQENFGIVPINDMRDSIWTCSYRKYDELRNPETGWVKDTRDI
jgi:hypothetical protein